ncbi:MAG: NADH-quinone oxidoreductase subunit C [Betaproteobacteria bacterium HGW-Betaproteobacteria-22]|nr:MAG: NADH-quinone oxidoreductase subunit C [Betaproteobacteria bacterium HGW-Betaproteobacteria-22]
MSAKLEQLSAKLKDRLGEKITRQTVAFDEVTIECHASDYLAVSKLIRDDASFKFEQLIDLCGVDYQGYADGAYEGPRYAVVVHFLSVSLNQRLRLRVFAVDDAFPVLPTLVDLWPVANWFEREAFDLYGILFENHPDLRRLLTDYGFVGHPFRKDFPMIGNVEMRYDPEQQRVIYQPVSIELRNNVPRVIRNEGVHS